MSLAAGDTSVARSEAVRCRDDCRGRYSSGLWLFTYPILLCIMLLCILGCVYGRQVQSMEINKDLIAASSTPIVLAILTGDSYGYSIIKRVRGGVSGGRLGGRTGCSTLFCIGLSGSATSRRAGKVQTAAAVAVLSDHAAGPGSACRGTQAVASSGRYATRHGGRSPVSYRPTSLASAALVAEGSDDASPRSYGIARRTDRPMAELPPPRKAIHSVDVAELEDHLREQVAVWSTRGSPLMKRSWWR